jgi:hypothetical protein
MEDLAMLTDELERVVTRRRVVATGAKLAYAAPLVAVSFKLSTRGAAAISQPQELDCFHSSNSDHPQPGCKEACTSTGCSGDACDGCGQAGHPCDACCGTQGNICPSADYCDPTCYTCTKGSGGSSDSVDFHCGG